MSPNSSSWHVFVMKMQYIVCEVLTKSAPSMLLRSNAAFNSRTPNFVSLPEIGTALHMQSADNSEPTCSKHFTNAFIKNKTQYSTIVKVTVPQGRLHYRFVYTEIAHTVL
jgi:hypothetical protein